MRVLRFTCRLDESRPPEIGEVSRNCRLRNSQNLDDVAHTQLSCGQTAQNAESRWIGESLEQRIKLDDCGWRGYAGRQFFSPGLLV